MEKLQHEAEWCLLQNQFESYEKHSLYIKLTSVLVLLLSQLIDAQFVLVLSMLLVLWLQDAIWKTFQSRFLPRLLQIERAIRDGADIDELQFNSEYERVERAGISKILEYVKQALRPTIAFPHGVLVVLFVVLNVAQS